MFELIGFARTIQVDPYIGITGTIYFRIQFSMTHSKLLFDIWTKYWVTWKITNCIDQDLYATFLFSSRKGVFLTARESIWTLCLYFINYFHAAYNDESVSMGKWLIILQSTQPIRNILNILFVSYFFHNLYK